MEATSCTSTFGPQGQPATGSQSVWCYTFLENSLAQSSASWCCSFALLAPPKDAVLPLLLSYLAFPTGLAWNLPPLFCPCWLARGEGPGLVPCGRYAGLALALPSPFGDHCLRRRAAFPGSEKKGGSYTDCPLPVPKICFPTTDVSSYCCILVFFC